MSGRTVLGPSVPYLNVLPERVVGCRLPKGWYICYVEDMPPWVKWAYSLITGLSTLWSVSQLVWWLFWGSGNAVIAGLKFNENGLVLVYGCLVSATLGLLIAPFCPVLWNRLKPRSLKFADMASEISLLRKAIDLKEDSEANHTRCMLMEERLEALDIPSPRLGSSDTWGQFLAHLEVFAENRRYREAQEIMAWL